MDPFVSLDAEREAALGRIAEDYADRRARGERPDIEEYARAHPELADVLRQMLPALADVGTASGTAAELIDLLRQVRPDPAATKSSTTARDPAAGGPVDPPERLGDYRILREVGRGGMGVVYEAEQTALGRRVALKVLPPTLGADPRRLQRFLHEARVVARLSHPNIVTAYDAGEHGGTHFLVLEFVAGTDLARVVRQRGPLPVAEALAHVIQAARGLAHAHAAGLVHRDIKPSNLLLTPDGTVKVLDLGVARVYEELRAAGGDDAESLTQTGDMLGTVPYMAPEQAADPSRAGPPADIYSLGCTLYYLLTGRYLFEAATPLAAVLAHRDQPAPRLRAARPDVPPALETVFRRMVAKRPGDRYPSMADLTADLERLAGGRRPRRRLPVRWLAAGVIGATLLGALVLPRPGGEDGRPGPPAGAGGSAAPASPLDELALRSAGQWRGLPEPAVALGHGALTHWSPVSAVAFWHGHLASAGWDGTVRLWDPATGQAGAVLTAGERVGALAVAPDGSALAAGAKDGTVTVWDWPGIGPRERARFRAAERPDRPDGAWVVLAFTPDGRHLACADNTAAEPVLRLWTADRGERVRGWEVRLKHKVGALAGDAGGAPRLAAGDEGGAVRLLHAADGRAEPPLESGTAVRSLALRGGVLAFGDADGRVRVRFADGRTKVLSGHAGPVDALAFSPDGGRLASAGRDGHIRVWPVPPDQPAAARCDIPGPPAQTVAVAFSPDGGILASGGSDHAVRLWDADTGQPRLPPAAGAASVAVSPDGRHIAVTHDDGGVVVWDAAGGAVAESLRPPGGGAARAAFLRDGRLAVAGNDGRVTLWDIGGPDPRPNDPVRTLSGAPPFVRALAVSPDGRWLAAAGQGLRTTVWDLGTGEGAAAVSETPEPVNGLAFSPDGRRLAAVGGDLNDPNRHPGTLTVWDLPGRVPALTVGPKDRGSSAGALAAVAFSPDGRRLVTTGFDPETDLTVRDAADGREVQRLPGHAHAGLGVAYSPDGQTIASCGADGTVRLTGTGAAGETRVIQVGPKFGMVRDLAFSPCGRHLLTANGNGTVTVLRLAPPPR